MTKSYVVGWCAGLLALGLVMANASAMEQASTPPAGSTTVVAEKDEPAQGDVPLIPLIERESTSSQSADESADTSDETPVATDNLVELAEQEVAPREFVVYIVRHMEKEDSSLDPGLTAGGVRRADGLAQLLSSAEVERIFSTLYRRSAGTALPLARTLAIPLEFYQPDAGDELIATLLDAGQSALVVGHSNTVADLVNALGGTAEELSEHTYGDIFQLVIRIDGDDHDVRQVRLQAPLIVSERRGQR